MTEAELLANLPADGVRVWRLAGDYPSLHAVSRDQRIYWTSRNGENWGGPLSMNGDGFDYYIANPKIWTEITPPPTTPTPSLRDQRIAEAWERWPDGRLFERRDSENHRPTLRMCLPNFTWTLVPNGREWDDRNDTATADSYATDNDFTEIPRPAAVPTLPDPSGDLPDGTRVRDGLWQKFRVERTDGRDKPGGDKAAAKYFVLDYAQDPFARVALAAYAEACRRELPQLATDLDAALTPPLSALDGAPGSLWRDPEHDTTWARVCVTGSNVMFRQVAGRQTDFEGQLLSGYGNGDHATIARLVPAEATS